jgi:hypothetical protein
VGTVDIFFFQVFYDHAQNSCPTEAEVVTIGQQLAANTSLQSDLGILCIM